MAARPGAALVAAGGGAGAARLPQPAVRWPRRQSVA
jgi:hypothetical protein